MLASILISRVMATPQYPDFLSGSNPFSSSGGDGSSSPSSSSSSSSDNSLGNFNFGQNGDGNSAPFDIDAAMQARSVHGALAALAMVVLFPVGSIAMRVIPGPIWIHAMAQIIAYVVYIAGVGLGLYLVREVQIPGQGSLVC